MIQLCHRRLGPIVVVAIVLRAMIMGPNGVAAPKTTAHIHWREWHQGPSPVERQFRPDKWGGEPGIPPPPLTGRAFRTRAIEGLEREENNVQWARANAITPRLNFSHNLRRIFPPGLYREHPEFFPDEAGRRLQPSNEARWWQPDLGREDVAWWAAEAAREFFIARPEEVSFALGINDGLIFGESPETRALTLPVRWFRERPDYANLVFAFMNRAATDLGRTHPEKYLGALAYYWGENTPDFPVHPRVIPFLTADRSQGYDPAFLQEDRALQKRWVSVFEQTKANAARPIASNWKVEKQGATPEIRLGLYDYLYGAGFLVPRFHPHLLAQHLRFTRRLGFTDYYAEMNPNWGLDGPQPWLVAQLLQDPEQSADKLLAEYFRRYFKEAAVPMRRFFAKCEKQWMHQAGPAYWLKHYRNESQAILFPTVVCEELRMQLNEAAKRAKSNVVRVRVRQVSDAFGVSERFVTMQEARDRLTRLALADDSKEAELQRVVSEFTTAREEFKRYTQGLQQAQPGLIAPFKIADYLTNDPTAMALARFGETRVRGREGDRLMINGSFMGNAQPARQIAGLTYSVALPRPWQSRVEPSEHQAAILRDGVLRISGTKDTAFFQWVAIPAESPAIRATIEVRGKVSSSGVVSLHLGWLDEAQRHLGIAIVRLPAGEWLEWRTLLQVAKPPPGAVWVGIGARIQHQQAGDWLECKGLELKVLE